MEKSKGLSGNNTRFNIRQQFFTVEETFEILSLVLSPIYLSCYHKIRFKRRFWENVSKVLEAKGIVGHSRIVMRTFCQHKDIYVQLKNYGSDNEKSTWLYYDLFERAFQQFKTDRPDLTDDGLERFVNFENFTQIDNGASWDDGTKTMKPPGLTDDALEQFVDLETFTNKGNGARWDAGTKIIKHPGFTDGVDENNGKGSEEQMDDMGLLSSLSDVPRSHSSYYYQGTEHRLHELNKRLQQVTKNSDKYWWHSFATEFFEDDASLTLNIFLANGPKSYTVGRTLIPGYFRSIFEGGATELYFQLKYNKESFHNTSVVLDCEHCSMVTHYGEPMFAELSAEGPLRLEFARDDRMRIKSWHMAVRQHNELITRTVLHQRLRENDLNNMEKLFKNIIWPGRIRNSTLNYLGLSHHGGITNSTLNYLGLCAILQPMQGLMSQQKAYAVSPRNLLKATVSQKWQFMATRPIQRS